MRTIIYHGGCPDGLTAAWLIARSDRTKPARAFAHHHGNEPQQQPPGGGELWCLDLAFPPETLERWSGRFNRIITLDHHKTNAHIHAGHNQTLDETLAQVEDPSWRGIATTIDLTRSGCGLAAEAAAHLNPATATPDFVYDIEDRDLWAWRREGSRDVCFALDEAFQQEKFSAVCAKLELATLVTRETLKERGAPLAAQFDETCLHYAQNADWHTIAGHRIPLAEVSDAYYGSQTASILLSTHPNAPFAGYKHTDEYGDIKIGLRSEDSREDVAAIAEKHGGGGHRNAAGFKLTSDTAASPSRM